MNSLDDNNLFKAARFYASLGWEVFPIKAGLKTPMTAHGVRDATSDLSQIESWWRRSSNANVAVACGPGSGVYVLDIDVNHKGNPANGIESLKKYPEMSHTVKQETPNGGLHLFFSADSSDPPKSKNNPDEGIDVRCDGYYVLLAPSMADGRQYRWVNGCSPGQVSLAPFPECFRCNPEPPRQELDQAASTTWPISTPTGGASASLLNRARSYLDECDPAIEGQCGHNKLFWACQCMVNGLRLSDSDALQLLWGYYNPRCWPPWDYTDEAQRKDFERKVAEARKNPPRDYEIGWLIEKEIDPALLPDLQAILANQKSEKVATIAVVNTSELGFLCNPPGLLGSLCAWINSTAMREQPFLTLGCSLTFLGALFGRKVRDANGSRTNLYCMSVANSCAGKNNAPYQIRRLCDASGSNDLLGGNDMASDASIESRMARHPSTFFMLDEIGFLLTHIKSGGSKHQAQIIKVLMDLYSAAGSTFKGREYAEVENQRTIVQPCCCLFGTSTPDRFQSGISSDELADGWLSRCLVFHTDSFPEKDYERPEILVPQELIEAVSKWWQCSTRPVIEGNSLAPFQSPDGVVPDPFVVPTNRDAEMRFRRFNKFCETRGRNARDVASLWYKAEENARKIALVVASGMSFEAPVITIAIADYSTRLVNYLVTSFIAIFVPNIANNEIEHVKVTLLKVIGKSGISGCKKRAISRSRELRKVSAKLRKECLTDLVDSGEIITETHPSGGVLHWTEQTYAEKKS